METQIKSSFHRGICKKCNTQRILNETNLCADCISIEDYLKYVAGK